MEPSPHRSAKFAALGLGVRGHVADVQIALPGRRVLGQLSEVTLAVLVGNIGRSAEEVEDGLLHAADDGAGAEHAGVENADGLDERFLGHIVPGGW